MMRDLIIKRDCLSLTTRNLLKIIDTNAITNLRYPRVKQNTESRLLPSINDGGFKTASDTNVVAKGCE